MSSINSSVEIAGDHFKYLRAFEKLPFKKSTSLGLKNFLSKSTITSPVSKFIAFSFRPFPFHLIRSESFFAVKLINLLLYSPC